MMGRQRRDQGKLFYEFRLDDRIPKNHLLRRIDTVDCRLCKLSETQCREASVPLISVRAGVPAGAF